MKGRFTATDYIVAAFLGAAIGTAAAYIIHDDCQEQAAEVQAYLDSDQYRIDRANHMKRLEGNQMNEYEIGNHFEVHGRIGWPDPDPDEPDFSNPDEWDDDYDYFEDK